MAQVIREANQNNQGPIPMDTAVVFDEADTTVAEPAINAATSELIQGAMTWDPRARKLEAQKQLRIDIKLDLMRGQLEPGQELTQDDLAFVRDTVDGETKDGDGIDDIITDCLKEIDQRLSLIPGCDERISFHRKRKARAEKAIEVSRAFIERAMIIDECVGKGKGKQLAIATITTRPATAQFELTDETAIPAKYFVRPDPVVDTTALKAHVMGRHKAMMKALDIKDQTEREQALAKVQADYGDELPGCGVKVDGFTTSIKWG